MQSNPMERPSFTQIVVDLDQIDLNDQTEGGNLEASVFANILIMFFTIVSNIIMLRERVLHEVTDFCGNPTYAPGKETVVKINDRG